MVWEIGTHSAHAATLLVTPPAVQQRGSRTVCSQDNTPYRTSKEDVDRIQLPYTTPKTEKKMGKAFHLYMLGFRLHYWTTLKEFTGPFQHCQG
jgi:hypothetical protein